MKYPLMTLKNMALIFPNPLLGQSLKFDHDYVNIRGRFLESLFEAALKLDLGDSNHKSLQGLENESEKELTTADTTVVPPVLEETRKDSAIEVETDLKIKSPQSCSEDADLIEVIPHIHKSLLEMKIDSKSMFDLLDADIPLCI